MAGDPHDPPLDPQLEVDWIEADAFADGRTGRLGLTVLPGKRGASDRYPGLVYRRDLEADLTRLVGLGVRRLLLLVEDHELARWGDPDIVERAEAHGIAVERRPTPDGSPPPTVEEGDAALAWLRDARERGDVAVACMGGIGRTGTIAACALVDAGWTPDDAIAAVRRIRHPEAVETAEQEAYVRARAAR